MKYKELLPDNENYNFSIDILHKVFLEKLRLPFTSKSMFMVLSGAKGFGKTYLICLLSLFFVTNFKDYNAILSRYTFKSARASYSAMLKKVMSDLEIHGVTLKQAVEERNIKSHDSDNKCDFIWPNGRLINIVGFDNTSNWEGVPAAVGDWGMFAIDEVIPLKETIQDEEGYIYQLLNMIIQIARGQKLTTSLEPIAELTYQDWSILKKHLIIFGFNNHDTSHVIYQLFVHAIVPLTEQRKKELEENAVTFGINEHFLNVGATVIRGTTAINEANLNDKVKEIGEGIKETFPEIYESLFMGGEHELSIDQYSYRKDLKENAQFFNPQEFYWKNNQRYYFDLIAIGCDYADGGEYGDDAVAILIGYEFDKETEIVTGIYILEELSINTRQFRDMTKKVKHIADTIYNWTPKYEHTDNRIFLEDQLKFRIGQDSKTVKDFLKLILKSDYKLDEEMLDNNFGIFRSTGKYGWSIADRHYMWKRLLSEKKLFFSNNLAVTKEISGEEIVIKPHGHLYEQLYKCLNHPDKKIRDERPKNNKLDAINAAEHSLSFVRFKLFNF